MAFLGCFPLPVAFLQIYILSNEFRKRCKELSLSLHVLIAMFMFAQLCLQSCMFALQQACVIMYNSGHNTDTQLALE